MSEDRDKVRQSAVDAEKREVSDPRFDTRLPMALESMTLAVNRYLLRRDALLFITDTQERRKPGTREGKVDELKAAHFNMVVQMEHVLGILKTGKL